MSDEATNPPPNVFLIFALIRVFCELTRESTRIYNEDVSVVRAKVSLIASPLFTPC